MPSVRFLKHLPTRSFTRNLVCAAAAMVALSSNVLAASAAADAQARYRQDMALCNSGQSNQDQATCRTEARNALAEAWRGGLTDAPGQYDQNARQRCAAHEGLDRTACESRMRGEGKADGSVAAGGILRESVTTVPSK